MTISDGKAPAHKLVYTFLKEDEPRSGETNKIQRIYTIEGDKIYSIAYLAEIDKYDDSLPLVEKMVDSFRLSDSASSSSTTQVQSSDRSSEDNNGSGNCDRISYPDPNVCIPPYPPDLNCPDIPYKNFRVLGSDPHGFDGDNDGVGCDSTIGGGNTPAPVPPPENGDENCDPSYPDVCIAPYPPDLNCPDIPYKDFQVIGNDPHGFDRDNDGLGCDTAGGRVTPPDNGVGTPPDNGNGNCDPSYPGVCIRSPPPDLNCPDIPYKNFRVTGGDPHGFDRDNDGIGCDSATSTSTPTPEPVACDDTPGSAGLGFPQEEITECQQEEWDKCQNQPGGYSATQRCDTLHEIFQDDDCLGYASQEECDAALSGQPIITPTPMPPITPPEQSLLTPTPVLSPPFDPPELFGLRTPTPTPPVIYDPSPLARSQPQPQCEFGVNTETGLCNTEDIPTEPLPPTPEPTTTPDEDVEESPEEESQEETEEESEGNGESNAGSTFE
jgi:hypothetical protein